METKIKQRKGLIESSKKILKDGSINNWNESA